MNDTTKSKASRAADERFVARGRQAYLILPTWRVASPYMEGFTSLHGGFDFPTWENGICGGRGAPALPFRPRWSWPPRREKRIVRRAGGNVMESVVGARRTFHAEDHAEAACRIGGYETMRRRAFTG